MKTSAMASDALVDPHALEGVEPPDVSGIVTEDDTPVDNLYSAKQQRLLVSSLYSSWQPKDPDDGAPRQFLGCSNVGLFPSVREPPLVPDAFVSLDVTPRQDLWEKRNRTYFFWEFGKPPEVVIEVVSNRKGGELGEKKRRYARMRIAHYVVWDPGLHLGEGEGGPALRAFELRGDVYVASDPALLSSVQLGVAPWNGAFEGVTDTWLRWFHPDGAMLLTGDEKALVDRTAAQAAQSQALAAQAEAESAQAQAESARAQADAARAQAEAERTRAERLAAKLRALGLEPDEG